MKNAGERRAIEKIVDYIQRSDRAVAAGLNTLTEELLKSGALTEDSAKRIATKVQEVFDETDGGRR